MLGDLSGRTALVTGAGSGIGRGIARVLAAQNALVAVTDLRTERASEVAAEIAGGRALALELVVTDRSSVDRAVERVVAEWGVLDILVNNAGVNTSSGRVDEESGRVNGESGRVNGEETEDDWDAMFAVNLRGAVRCCEAVVPGMRERRYGKIVNIASQGGHAAIRGGGAYQSSKAALLRYTKGLATSLAPRNINVNAVCPGAVWTRMQEASSLAMQRRDPSLARVSPEQIFLNTHGATVPLKPLATPVDIGNMVAFLASEDSRNITGQCIHVDGGVVLRD